MIFTDKSVFTDKCPTCGALEGLCLGLGLGLGGHCLGLGLAVIVLNCLARPNKFNALDRHRPNECYFHKLQFIYDVFTYTDSLSLILVIYPLISMHCVECVVRKCHRK